MAVDHDMDHPDLTYRRPVSAGAGSWPYDQPMQLILNVAVGGALGGDAPRGSGPFDLVVDEIAVFETSVTTEVRRSH